MDDARRLTNFVAEISEGGGIEVLTSDGPVVFTLLHVRGKKKAKVLTQTKRRNHIQRMPSPNHEARLE